MEWTGRLPRGEWETFITDVLDRYRSVAADDARQVNTFKFYQMQVELERPSRGPGLAR